MTLRLPAPYPNWVKCAANDNIVLQSNTVAIDCPRLFAPAGQVPPRRVSHIGVSDLTAATLARLAPATIVMPLFGQARDALEVIHDLERLGYRGRILVIGPALPDRTIVQDELRAAGPQGRLTLLSA